MFAFAAVILLFIVSTTFSEFTARSIDESATAIAHNAAPSIQHLAAARVEMRNLELTADAYLDAVETRGVDDRRQVLSSWNTVQSEFEAYQRLPSFPHEREKAIQLERDIRKLDGTLAELFADVAQKRITDARKVEMGVLYPLVEQTLIGSLSLIELNSERAAELAVQVERARDRSALFAFGLDAVSGILAVIVALLAARDVRRGAQLLEERNRLIARRAEELEQFAGRVAHDVLSPLMVVGLSLEVGQKLPPDDPKREETFQRGRTALQRVRTIVDGLLGFARAGAGPEPGAHVEVGEVVQALLVEIQPAAEARDIHVVVRGNLELQVACSAGVLASVLSNLVRNAIKYIGEVPERRVTVGSYAVGPKVRLEVEDTGPGLPPGLERTVWEPYVRAKGSLQPGIGLGLATVKRVAQAHGGSVGVRSNPGEGSLFWVELPRYEVLTRESGLLTATT